ncbi:MAG: TRIC cation channel family protein [Coriobacteriaceae bacterium]|uniref:trimeric intracellular cation channel family protein n=1 Tax=Tractidigestivibacter sp. TaxID=2847320 RepID=UPI002A83A411|nr:TRIC cation channel family protein [Tractidigestivibacter sp.]MCI6273186.1 TRIC cation channel family protein [Coriobacteriaceae bacterium]MCI6547247.1 TRIC cation channel family protein [Coriobacteriaceae bacterium]MCI6843491.1 TRIC cation channel family protein [Coriobacteriaceae bacterium]MCI7437919.1 TRIC cation channel family protein [Coriobacteriaceae bacterium]MDD7584758.1 TRIC cation channel family protein [Coriobacteriaceae bacterium]
MPELFSRFGPETAAVSLPAWLDLLSVMVGAVSGILVARERRLDMVGFVGLAMLCGLGGGLVRDMIMQVGDVYMLKSLYAIPSTVGIGIAGFYFPTPFGRFPSILEWTDITAVGLFALMGTDKAIVYGTLPCSAILMGTLTGIGGGMLRDVFLGDVPRIFRPSNYYALCAVAGSTVYYALVMFAWLGKPWAAVACLVATVGLRRWSLHFNVVSQADVDLTPRVTGGVRRITRRVRRSTRRRG